MPPPPRKAAAGAGASSKLTPKKSAVGRKSPRSRGGLAYFGSAGDGVKVLVVSRVAGLFAELTRTFKEGVELVEAAWEEETGALTHSARVSLRKAEVIVGDPPLLAPLLRDASSVRWVQSTFAGVDSIIRQRELDAEEAQSRRAEREQLKKDLERESEELEVKRSELQKKLAAAERAVADAAKLVASIQRTELNELRSMTQPPAAVKMCMEAVCVLVGMQVNSWADVLRETRGNATFIQEVLALKAADIPKETTIRIQSAYLSQASFTEAACVRASKVSGSMYKYLVAMMSYAAEREKSRPLVTEVSGLEKRLDKLQDEAASLDSLFASVQLARFTLTRIGGVFGPHIASYVMAHLLARERKLFELKALQAKSTWAPKDAPEASYRALTQVTLGILGMGDIGTEVARVAKAMGLRVVGMVRSKTKADRQEVTIDKLVVGGENSSQVLRESDYLVSVLPSTAATRGLLDGPALQSCKPGCVLINVGRGDLVKETTIIKALDKGWIAAAILDVFANEPLKESSPLWQHPAVTITPHIAARSFASDIVQVFGDNLRRYTGGEDLRYKVNLLDDY